MHLSHNQKFQCPVCAHELHSFEADVLENHGSWCLVETACQYCGSSSLGLMVGRGKKVKHVKLLSDIQKETHRHGNAEDDYIDEILKKEPLWAES